MTGATYAAVVDEPYRHPEPDRLNGRWVIGYRTALEILALTAPRVPWDGTLLLGRPVELTLGEGLAFQPTRNRVIA